MDRATSLTRRNVAFAGVACVAILVLLLRPSPSSAVPTTFPKAFPDFDAAKARAIEVSHTTKKDGKDVEEKVRLVQQGTDDWVVESAGRYPARLAAVKRFLDGLSGIEVRNTPTTSPERFAQFAGTDGFTEVRVLEDGDRARLSFGIGSGNAEGSWSDRYLRIDETGLAAAAGATAGTPAKARVVVARGGELSDVRADVLSWVESRFWPTLTEAEVQVLTVEQRAKDRTIELRRGTKGEKDADDPWTMTKPEEGKTHLDRVKNLLRSFTGLTISRVIGTDPAPDADAKHGFDKPDLVITGTGRVPAGARPGDVAPVWTITIGKKSDEKDVDGWFARRTTNGKTEPFVLLVADYALGEFRAEPATLLDKPEPTAPPKDGEKPKEGEKPKDGTTPPTPPAGGGTTDAPGMGAKTPPSEPAMGTPPSPPSAPPVAPPAPPPAPPAMDGDKPR